MSRQQPRPSSAASSIYHAFYDDTLDEVIGDMTDEEIISSRNISVPRTASPTNTTWSSPSTSTSREGSSQRSNASISNVYPTTEARKSGNSSPLLSQGYAIPAPRTPSKPKGTYREQASPSTPLRTRAFHTPASPGTPSTPSTPLSPALSSRIREAFNLFSPTSKRSRSENRPIVDTDPESEEEREVESLVTDGKPLRPLLGSNPLCQSNSFSSASSGDSYWSMESGSTSSSSFQDECSTTLFPSVPPSPTKRRKLEPEQSMPQAASLGGPSTSQNRRPMTIDTDNVLGRPSTSGYQTGSISSHSSLAQPVDNPYYTADISDRCHIPSGLKRPVNAPPEVANFHINTDMLEVHVISHCDDTQKLFDEKQIAWGVQYELARGVVLGRWTWEDVRMNVDQLTGTNSEAAYRVLAVMRGTAARNYSNANLSLWQELDREEKAILENRSRGLGLMGPWEGHQADWYGGQVQQILRLVKEGGSYKICLAPMESRRSYRFARFYGSRRILQLRIPKTLVMEEFQNVKQFLQRKFVLCGRVFVPYHVKDGGLYLVEVNEDKFRSPQTWCGDQYRLSFSGFCEWHNPFAFNFNQPLAKMVTRNALGFSNSVPAIEFSSENIMYLGDIYSTSYQGGKAEAKDIMTDGAGLINRAALKVICTRMGYKSLPAAIQGRIAGAKGLFCLHPYDSHSEPRIWIRDSQLKIHLPLPLEQRAHMILDLLCVSMPSSSFSLSQQSVLNLSYNGVPNELLISLMKEGLLETFSPYLDWDQPLAMVHLLDAVSKNGRVQISRLQRLTTAGASRALGLSRNEWRHEDVDLVMEKENDSSEYSDFTGRNDGGLSSSINEVAVELIQAGFHPAENDLLWEKIQYIIKTAIDSAVEKCRIPLPYSLSGFIIPDPIDVLEEGQIFYCSSELLRDPETDLLSGRVLTGEIIIGRYPLRLPSDMQKVVAVDIPALREYMDVIVASTRGSHSLASMLAGGDHDGDAPFLTWNPKIIQHFESKEVIPPPSTLMDYFERDVESVKQFCQRMKSLKRYFIQASYMDTLLDGLTDHQVGLYSGFHERATEMLGYDHSESIRLAYTFNTLLDAGKTGHRLKPGVLQDDRKRFAWSEETKQGTILSQIRESAEATRKELQHRLSALKQPYSGGDKDLRKPYDKFFEVALFFLDKHKFNGYYDEFDLIRKQVDASLTLWNEGCGASRASATPSKGKIKHSKESEDRMASAAREFNAPIEGIFLIQNLEELKASYAYHLKPRFAFTVAFRELCTIKSRYSPGGMAPSCRIFDELKTIPSSSLRALIKSRDDTSW